MPQSKKTTMPFYDENDLPVTVVDTLTFYHQQVVKIRESYVQCR